MQQNKQLDFNLNEKGPVCIYSVLSVTAVVFWEESREHEMGPLLNSH